MYGLERGEVGLDGGQVGGRVVHDVEGERCGVVQPPQYVRDGAHDDPLLVGQVAWHEHRHRWVVPTRYGRCHAPVAQAAERVVEDDDGKEGVDNAHEQQCRAEEVDSDVRRRGGWRQVGQW